MSNEGQERKPFPLRGVLAETKEESEAEVRRLEQRPAIKDVAKPDLGPPKPILASSAETSRSRGKSDYQKYLRSPHWQVTRARAIADADGCCVQCGSSDYPQVHHLHYARLGREAPEDLMVLCRECHEKEHQRQRQYLRLRNKYTTRNGYRVEIDTFDDEGFPDRYIARMPFGHPDERELRMASLAIHVTSHQLLEPGDVMDALAILMDHHQRAWIEYMKKSRRRAKRDAS